MLSTAKLIDCTDVVSFGVSTVPLMLVTNNCITDLVKSVTCEYTLVLVLVPDEFELEEVVMTELSCFSLLIASPNLSNLDVG